MIQLRFREPGQEDWTYLNVSGELEDNLVSLLVSRVLAITSSFGDLHVQELREEGWENYED